VLGKNRLLCSKCGKAHLAIGTEVACCHHCGAPYFSEVSENGRTA
jgi:predicted amidophosphoribosyltransferase